MARSDAWRSRIIGYDDVDPSTLVAHPANWRTHPVAQRDALAGVLSDVGVVQAIIVNERTGRIVDGHLRVSLAVERGEPTIPVVYVDLDDDEERLVLATLDPLSQMAEQDADAFDALLSSVAPSDESVVELVQFLARSHGLTDPDTPAEHWRGMPTFEHDDARAHREIIVRFKDADAVALFASVLGRSISESTQSLWFPDDGLAPIAGSYYDDE